MTGATRRDRAIMRLTRGFISLHALLSRLAASEPTFDYGVAFGTREGNSNINLSNISAKTMSSSASCFAMILMS